jgi:hypothetical protein
VAAATVTATPAAAAITGKEAGFAARLSADTLPNGLLDDIMTTSSF